MTDKKPTFFDALGLIVTDAADAIGSLLVETVDSVVSSIEKMGDEPPSDPPDVKINAQDEPILRYFDFEHLPSYLQAISIPFYEMANSLVAMLPAGPERTVALRKLLESKDAAVRSALAKK